MAGMWSELRCTLLLSASMAGAHGGSRWHACMGTCRFLLEPLAALDGSMGAGAPRPCVLLLLDALDEADDGGRGWQPVTSLIAHE